MGVSEAYGRAIGTNFSFSSIAQSPPPEPELPLPRRGSEALAREGGRRAKLAKPTLRTSGSPMLTATGPPQQEVQDSFRFTRNDWGPLRFVKLHQPRDLRLPRAREDTPKRLPNRPERGLATDDLRRLKLAHVCGKGANSGNPPTPRSGAYWSCPFIGLIWPWGGGLLLRHS